MSFPALEEIYDLTTEELKQLQTKLQNNYSGHQDLLQTVKLQIEERKTLQFFAKLCQADNPYAKKVTDFNSEFIRLAQEAIIKNQSLSFKYQTSLPDNNQNYEKQLIQNRIKKQQIRQQEQKKQLVSFCINANQEQNDTMHNKFTSNIEKSILSEKQIDTDEISIKSEKYPKNDDVSVTTLRSTSKDSQKTQNLSRSTMKMGIGFNRKKKNKMAQIIQNTLARTKVDTVITIKRSGAQSPKKNNYEKKFHIPGQKHENTELKKKANHLLTNKIQQPKAASIKNSKKQDNTGIIKNAKQITNRTRAQVQSVKLPKLNPYKDLVQMVKKEQQQRKNKTQKHIKIKTDQTQDSLPNVTKNKNIRESDNKLDNTIHANANNNDDEKIEQEIQANYRSRESSDNNAQQILQQINNEEVSIIKQEECEQSMSPQKLQKVVNINNKTADVNTDGINEYKGSSNIKIGINKVEVQYQNHMQYVHDSKQGYNFKRLNQQQVRCDSIKQKKSTKKISNNQNDQVSEIDKKLLYLTVQKQHKQNQIQQQKQQQQIIINGQKNIETKPNIVNEQQPIDFTKKLLEQIDKEQEYYFFDKQKKAQLLVSDKLQQQQNDDDNDNNYENNKQQHINENRQDHNSHTPQQKQKKCYSEQYWAHIRQQAQLKIKRFRQQKQIEKLRQFEHIQPQKHNSNRHKHKQQEWQQQLSDQDQLQSNKNQLPAQSHSQLNSTASKFTSQIATKKQQLQKIKDKIMQNKTNQLLNSKNQVKLNIPKVVHPKPQFNYLEIYPTFNHIFSVMYLKPAHQAVQDIPNLMRQLKTLFTNHIQHCQHNKSVFQPALFLPFDHHGTFQIKEPKQLLMHAENTYVDLKVMIDRIQKFNKNLQGAFQNSVSDKRFFRVVKSKQEVYDIITTSFLRNIGWKQLPHGSGLRTSWNLFWSWSKPEVDMNKLLVWQRINHFPFNKNLSRKDLLYKNLEYFRKTYRVPINFLPLTFNLPKQFSQLSIKFHEQQVLNKDKNYWIMKPIGKSRGRGIKVISALAELNYIDNIVVQKYIANPLLLDGYKFDMRIYVLVTSFHPLQAFVYREGFARLSTEKFNMSVNSIKNTFIHLTNFSINKNNLQAKSNFIGGSKLSMKTLKDKLTKMGYSFNTIWNNVHDIIIKSLLGCSVSVPSFPTAFQLFGYDIMIDEEGQCHLIQINASPSLERSFIIDQIIKQNLIDDIFDIVNPPDFDKKQLIEVLSERIQMITDKKKITAEDDLIGLARILKYKPIRKIGELPQKMGLFQRVAPSQASLEIQKLIKSKSGANNPRNID